MYPVFCSATKETNHPLQNGSIDDSQEQAATMNEDILNTVYSTSLEFGENFHKPVIDIVEEFYPYIADDEKSSIADYIEQTRNTIEKYFYDKYDYKNEKANKELYQQGKQWMNNKNVNRAAAQGMYYAWHG